MEALTLKDAIHVNTTVNEENIAYPADSKLVVKIINRPNKIGKAHSVSSDALSSRSVFFLQPVRPISLSDTRYWSSPGLAAEGIG